MSCPFVAEGDRLRQNIDDKSLESRSSFGTLRMANTTLTGSGGNSQ
jgi:hypothetical protein